jgi:DNA-directed RNA polymerase subunit delta
VGTNVTPDQKKKIAQRTLDECYLILKSNRKPMNFRELLAAGWKKIQPETELTGSILANLYTNLNLDARFVPLGKGEWGLTEWQSRPARSSIPATSLLGRTYQDERHHKSTKLDSDDLSEIIIEESAIIEEPYLPLDDSEEEPWDEEEGEGQED